MRQVLILLLTLFISVTANAAQSIDPSEDWQLLETNHFKIYFLEPYREFAQVSAAELEASRELLQTQQQRTLAPKIDVVVFDPLNDSNGFAMPFSQRPFMGLYTTPPLSDSMISNSSSWQQLLALHEYVHLVHLSQPSRNEWVDALRRFYDLADVLFGATERWVAEGYATLLESKLTGRGRLYDAQVEAMLRQFAREGAWPTYGELNKVEGRYRVGNMAYLIGGRFMAYLEQKFGEGTLDAVWQRMRAKEIRDFDEAFNGMYQRSASELYQRFVAEFTQMVLNQEQPVPEATTLWLDGQYEIRDPALSPAGDKLVLVDISPRKTGRAFLRVFSTKDNQKAREKFDESNKSLLENDPLDVAPNAPLVFPREELYALPQLNGRGLRNPRWLNDETIIFGRFTEDAKGRHQDLFAWFLQTGEVKQLTRSANIRRFDINRFENYLLAEKNQFGYSSLVRLEFATSGELTEQVLVTGKVTDTFDFIRFNPKYSSQFAYLKKSANQAWRLWLQDVNSEHKLAIPLPKGYQFLSYVNWSNNGEHLYFVAGQNEQMAIYRYRVQDGSVEKLNAGQMTFGWPQELQVGGDLALLFTSYRGTGPNLYLHQLNPSSWQKLSGSELFNTELLNNELSANQDFTYLNARSASALKMPAAIASSQQLLGQNGKNFEANYSDYREAWSWQNQDTTFTLSGVTSTESVSTVELGIKSSDVLQRLNWSATVGGSLFDDSISGLSGAVNYNGWPLKLSADIHYVELTPRAQAEPVYASAREYAGMGLDMSLPYGIYSGLLETYRGEITLGFEHVEQQTLSYRVAQQQALSLSHQQFWFYDVQDWSIWQRSNIRYLQGEVDYGYSANADDWTGLDFDVELALGWKSWQLGWQYQSNERNDANSNLLQIGGVESNLINAQMAPNIVFAQELPFLSALTNDFERATTFLSRKNQTWQLYYSQLLLNGNEFVDIYGVRDRFALNFIRSGLTHLKGEYGLYLVEDMLAEYNAGFYLGLRYQF